MDASMNEHDALKFAITAAKQSPCQKSKRGVVLWKNRDGNPNYFTHGVTLGCNHLPKPFVCDGSAACREACSKTCVHAEQDVIIKARFCLFEFDMLHVKVVNGEAVPSGPPSCWQCSKLILNANIRLMWLLHEDGLSSYTPEEFHNLTLKHCNLLRLE